MVTLSSQEMAALEVNAEYFGVSTLQLMENAGRAVAGEVTKRFERSSKVIILAGTGGNGGDGFVAARHLSNLGYSVDVVLIGRPTDIKRTIVKSNWDAITFMTDSVKIVVADDSSLIPDINGDVAIDALLGTGAHGPLRQPILEAVRVLNAATCFTLSVDVPTGVDSDTGCITNRAVKADMTVTFHKAKRGLLEAKSYVGDLIVADVGIPREAETYVGPGDVLFTRKARLPESHKGAYGRLLVIGGSDTFSGAPFLAAMAALRTGVDLVHVAAPSQTAHDIAAMSPNLITIKLEGNHLFPEHCGVLRTFIENSTAVVLGPGLGLHRDTVTAVQGLIELIGKSGTPLLLDADGLKSFAEFKYTACTPLVLTPHGGEFQTLTGKELPQRLGEKVDLVRETARDLSATILLKGPIDVVSDGTRVKINKIIHNPGMTVGGTGDVLSGIVGALLSQGFSPFRSAVSGVFINGAAGDFVLRERGYHMVATDLIEWIPKVMDDPQSHVAVRRMRQARW
jgi:NAD(P)H-hydrate epimerase